MQCPSRFVYSEALTSTGYLCPYYLPLIIQLGSPTMLSAWQQVTFYLPLVDI